MTEHSDEHAGAEGLAWLYAGGKDATAHAYAPGRLRALCGAGPRRDEARPAGAARWRCGRCFDAVDPWIVARQLEERAALEARDEAELEGED